MYTAIARARSPIRMMDILTTAIQRTAVPQRQPWRLVADPSGYIYKWLIGYSSLLGAIGGVLIADYIVLRKTRIDLAGLYRKDGPYWYRHGFNPLALIALAAGIAPCVPGFLNAVDLIKASDLWVELYHFAWIISLVISFVVYLVLMTATRRMRTQEGSQASPSVCSERG